MLPTFRSLIAKELVKKYGLSQVEVAERMGITQAAVSQYLKMKRGKGTIKQINLMNKIEKLANRTAKEISENKTSPKDVMSTACQLCIEMNTTEQDG